MRDRLIELLGNFPAWHSTLKETWMPEAVNRLADHLIANSVIVPPCNVGQIVWFIRSCTRKVGIVETKVEKVVLKHGGLYIKLGCNSMYETSCNSIGKTVFLTKEEAERALKGGAE